MRGGWARSGGGAVGDGVADGGLVGVGDLRGVFDFVGLEAAVERPFCDGEGMETPVHPPGAQKGVVVQDDVLAGRPTFPPVHRGFFEEEGEWDLEGEIALPVFCLNCFVVLQDGSAVCRVKAAHGPVGKLHVVPEEGEVEELTRADIEQLRTKQGNEILFLDELLDFLEDKSGLYVEFEMKTHPASSYPEERLAEYCDKLYRQVMAKRPADALYLFTSSDYRGLRYLQSHYPDAELLLITPKPCNQETIDLCKAFGIKRLGATMDGTSRESVRKAHEAGIIVSLWPGQSVEDFMLGVYLGCDFMCTDVPLRVKQWATEKTPWINVRY